MVEMTGGVVEDAEFEQQDAGHRHGDRKAEIDDDRVGAEPAQPVHEGQLDQQRGRHAEGDEPAKARSRWSRAGEAKPMGMDGLHLEAAGEDQRAVDQRVGDERGKRQRDVDAGPSRRA